MEVAIFFGSKSDTEVMRGAANALKEFGITYKAFVLSAHRVPEKLEETLEQVEKEGCKVIIAGAGLAAHLPGVIASQTVLPVIYTPVDMPSRSKFFAFCFVGAKCNVASFEVRHLFISSG